MTNFERVSINSGLIKLDGVLSTPKNSLNIGVLFLHGGGHADADRYHDVQSYLSGFGITSLAFSFRGCGKSQGVLKESNLSHRLADAVSALEYFMLRTRFSLDRIILWGSSMGGHLSCRMVGKYPTLNGLILQSAAAYGQAAESKFYGEEFKEEINRKQAWDGSLAFTNLSNYSGRVLIIYGEDDKVVPDGVKESFRTAAPSAQFHIISGYGHPMLRPETKDEKSAWVEMLTISTKFIIGK